MALLAVLLQLSGLLGFTWWLLAQLKDAHVSPPVQATVFVSWSLGLLALVLLPVDLVENGLLTPSEVAAPAITSDVGGAAVNASASSNGTLPLLAAGVAMHEEGYVHYLWAWQTLYWLTFLLSWLVLPFLTEFCQNGEFVLNQKIVSSVKRLVLHWTLLAGVCGVVVLYLVCVGHLSLFGLVGLAMASANTYGLLWLIALLGFGLVDVPRSFWRLRNPERRLQELHFRAVQVYDERVEAKFELEDVATVVHACYDRMLHAEGVSIILTSDMQFVKACLQQVKALVDYPDRDASSSTTHGQEDTAPDGVAKWWHHSMSDLRAVPRRPATVPGSPFASSVRTPSLSEVVELHRRVLVAIPERRRSEQAWIELCTQADRLCDRIKERQLPAPSGSPRASLGDIVRTVAVSLRRRLRRLVLAPVSVCCAVVSGVASVYVIWGELTMALSSTAVSLFRAFSRESGANASELLAFTLLLYMAACAYASLCKLRGFNRCALCSHRSSTELCLLKTTMYQCRLQFATGYNFLLLLDDRALTDRTAFAALFENMRVVHVLGRGFSVYAPMLMVLLVAFALSDGYARVMKRLGLEQYEQVMLGSSDHEAVIAKGQLLVQQGRERYRAVIRRRRNAAAPSGHYYSYSFATDGAQALLSDDNDDVSEDDSRMVERRDGSLGLHTGFA